MDSIWIILFLVHLHLGLFFFTFHIFKNVYPRINETNIHNNIIGILSFQNRLKDYLISTGLYFINWSLFYQLVSILSTGLYFKNKVKEGSYTGKKYYVFLIFGYFFSKCTFFEVVAFIFRLVVIQSTLCGSAYLNDSCFWWSIFPFNYQTAYGHQAFQGSDMLREAITHKYAWHPNRVVLCGHVKNKMHISTCKRSINTTLGKVLT